MCTMESAPPTCIWFLSLYEDRLKPHKIDNFIYASEKKLVIAILSKIIERLKKMYTHESKTSSSNEIKQLLQWPTIHMLHYFT